MERDERLLKDTIKDIIEKDLKPLWENRAVGAKKGNCVNRVLIKRTKKNILDRFNKLVREF